MDEDFNALFEGNKCKIDLHYIVFLKEWNPDQVERSLCSFANDFDGEVSGYIMVGVEEKNGIIKRPVVGIDIDELDKIKERLSGMVDYTFFLKEIELDGKCVLLIRTLVGRYHSCRLRKVGKEIPFDERGNLQIELSDISPALVLDYLYSVKSSLADQFSKIPFSDVLDSMGLYTGNEDHRVLKNVAAMMFCRHQAKFFPSTKVDIVIYPDGQDENPDYKINVPEIVGTVPEIIKQTLDYIRTIVILKKCVKPKDQEKSIVFSNYPYRAIKEAVVNALYHRNYQVRESVKIAIDPTRITVTSCSGPVSPFSWDVPLTDSCLQSCPSRNHCLGEYLKDLGLAEGRSTGISIIQDELSKNGSKPADIVIDENLNYFQIEIPCHEDFWDSFCPMV